MLKRPRLLVLSGRAGAGTTSAARGLYEELSGRGIPAIAVDGAAKVEELEALIDRSLTAAGLGTMAHELPRALGRFAGVAGIVAVDDAAGRDEVIIWDAGEIDGLLRLLAVAGAPRKELLGILPPMATLRAAQSLGADDLRAWEAILDSIEAVGAMLAQEDTRIMLLVDPDDGIEECLRTWIGQLSLLGAGCDAIIVNRVPMIGEGWPDRWARPRRQRVDALRGRGIPVIEIPQLVDEVRGHQAFRVGAGLMCDAGQVGRPLPHAVVERADGGYDLRIHLPGVNPGLVKVGCIGDALVAEVAGIRRQMALAPVLTRCEIEGAGMVGDWLVVRFSRNVTLWPEAS